MSRAASSPIQEKLAAVTSISAGERAAVAGLVAAVARVDGIAAIVLGGSHARGRATPSSDIDIGLFYHEDRPLSIEGLRRIVAEFDPRPEARATDLWEWGPWVNGGAWVAVDGFRIDLLYRCVEQVERTKQLEEELEARIAAGATESAERRDADQGADPSRGIGDEPSAATRPAAEA